MFRKVNFQKLNYPISNLSNFYSLINVVSASDLFRAASAGQLGVGLAPESEILNSSGLVNSSSHNPLDDPIMEDHRPSIL